MRLFKIMARFPWPFLVLLPAGLIAVLFYGWTRDDIIEDEVYNIWTPRRTEYNDDREYQQSVGKFDSAVSNFAAMAITRDGGNILTEERLEELRARMEKAEATTVEVNGNTFTYEDVCASNNVGLGTTYEFPCLRLSPMDWFQEAGWYFEENDRVTWYTDVIRKLLVGPRLPRFGVMNQICSSAGGDLSQSNACDKTILLRTNATFAVANGFPASYASPLLLLSDVGNLEMNDPCKICIESAFEATIETLTTSISGLFGVMFLELTRLAESGIVTNQAELAQLQGLMEQVGALAQTVDRAAVEDWYSYYVVRGLYANLGAASYVQTYAGFVALLGPACAVAGGTCPATVSGAEAAQQLLNHADNTFSSVTTAGAPFPFWSNGDGTGELFGGSEPVGGSGIDMSGTLLSSTAYLDLQNYGTEGWSPLYSNGFIDPFNATASPWFQLVESDPVFRWFIAGVTPMTSHCGNGFLTGTNLEGNPFDINTETAGGLAANSQNWCTKYNLPFEEDGTETQQHFARMWYDLLIDSPSFLGVTQGENSPYDYTLGTGCFYNLGGSRFSYTNMTTSDILSNSSRPLYNVDEGASNGAVDTNLFIGGAIPSVGEYSFENPLEQITVMQNIYPLLGGQLIPQRVGNCNRPGGPITISEEEGFEVLKLFKEQIEANWAEGWQDENAGDIQFVGFIDDQGGVVGSTGRILRDITLDNGVLTTISIILIAVFSAIFLFSCDIIESKVLVTSLGVLLVVISFYASVGAAILLGIKVNVNIAWTLPFIILGLGVDDMYIVLLALKGQRDYSEESFIEAMSEVVVPVSMTSLVNACMFGVMQFVDIPAVNLTAQVALIAVIFLYLTIILTYPAYCYLDMKRQQAGRADCLVCIRRNPEDINDREPKDSWIYTHIYKKLLLGDGFLTLLSTVIVTIMTGGLIAVGVWGIRERQIGLGLQDFFPDFHPSHVWATETTETVAAWGINIKWGAENYTDPDTQLYLIRQFERIVESAHVAETSTSSLWLADFNVWTSRHCTANFDRADPDILECGMDQVFPGDNSTCKGFWMPNAYNAREKVIGDGVSCITAEGGICRPTEQMHPLDLVELGIDPTNPGDALGKSWCPVFEDFTDDKLQFCLMRWYNHTGGGGDFVRDQASRTPYDQCEGDFFNDPVIDTPLLFSRGPSIFAFGLFSNQDYLDMIEETREICDDDSRVRCWMGGIPFDYWEQYLTIEAVLLQASAAAVAVGFGISFLFLFGKLSTEGIHPCSKMLKGSAMGGALIAGTTLLSLISVVGISVILGVHLTAFSAMSFLLSVGFAIEYSVHIVHRFMKAPPELTEPRDRVDYAMSFLLLPTFMSFVSSTIGSVCLAFTDFEFNSTFFFKPLITVMFVTYFVGCWSLPVLLKFLNIDSLQLGDPPHENDAQEEAPREQPVKPLKKTTGAYAAGVAKKDPIVSRASEYDVDDERSVLEEGEVDC